MHTPPRLWLSFLLLPVCLATAQSGGSKNAEAGNDKVRTIMETYAGRGTLADSTPMTPAADAVRAFQPREGLAVDLLAAEPTVQQPLYMNWDSRGRLWVMQYLQYQFPAGLKVMSYDSHLRAQFDRVPEPPPRGVPGADKVVVFEDTDGDGFFDKHTEPVTGLNIASAALPGAGAIWVLNPPYLLRYPDANSDGIPDADPEVVISGFGIEDTHSVANSLQWGVDGWLYGAHGSTCTAKVSSAATKNLRWEGQCIWRYHPVSKKIEVYAEGGGNTFSLEIDAKGRFFSGTNGGGTRGMHYEQGSYGIKGWGKHGPLTNPHAYGWFEHMRHEGDTRRFPQAFVIYEGGLLGPAFEGHILAPNSLANLVYVSARLPEGSSFRTKDDAPLLTSPDRWFRPVDAKVGPDGGLYLADWYDTRLSHVRPVDDWHKASGRIYRVRPAGAPPKLQPFDLHTAPPADLLKHLAHANRWFRRQAALEIAWRNLSELAPELRSLCLAHSNPNALDALFALDMLGGVQPPLLNTLLQHPDPYLRRWAVRIAGEKGADWKECAAPLEQLARTEEHPEVRAQLLASSKRLPASSGLPLLYAALKSLPEGDTHRPRLAWWALESTCETDHAALLHFLRNSPEFTQSPLFAQHLARRLAQRLASGNDAARMGAAGALFEALQNADTRSAFVEGIAATLDGAQPAGSPGALSTALTQLLAARDGGPLAAALRASQSGALPPALKLLADSKAPLQDRLAIAKILAETDHPDAAPALGTLLTNATLPVPLKRALLLAAARYPSIDVPAAVLSAYEARIASDVPLRDTALRVLASRVVWAETLLQAVDDWKVPAKHLSPEIVNLLAQHRTKSPAIDRALEHHWKGALGALPPEEKLQEAKRLRDALREDRGSAGAGRLLFQQLCASCHKLFGEGNLIGPELTGYERGNADFWLDNIVYPSLEIREGYANYTARTRGGQVYTGMLDSRSASQVVLRDLAGQKTSLRESDLASLEANPLSLMPEGLLRALTPAQVRDLFAFLMQPDPGSSK